MILARAALCFILIESIQLDDPAFAPSYQTDRCVDNISDGVNNTVWREFIKASRYENAR